MVADYAKSLLNGLGDFFQIIRSFFDMMPMPIQAILYLSIGGVLLLCILHMIFIRG